MTPFDLATLHAKCFITPRPWSADEFTELLANRHTFLCTQTGGFALGRVAGPEAELLTLAVDPDLRRRGIATSLVAAFEIKSATAGASHLILEVASDNIAATELYRTAGFVEAGIRKNYYDGPRGQHIDARVLSKAASVL